jgi:hypothetical protein
MNSLSAAFGLFDGGGKEEEEEEQEGPKDEERGHVEEGLSSAGVSIHVRNALIQGMTVPLSEEEQGGSTFSLETIQRAVACLRNYGMVILPKLFDPEKMRKLGGAAIRDLDCYLALAAARGAHAGSSDFGHSYLELASRHEGRYELRNGDAMRGALENGKEGGLNLQRHRGILSVLREACAAPGHALVEGQPGDEIVARDVGAFVSLPGAADQSLHADNDHLFWHQTLPPHVVTMFLPGCLITSDGDAALGHAETGTAREDQDLVGWTSFFPRTQRIEAAAAVLASPAVSLDDRRSVCPNLDAGDVILYDARLLHFGLSNRSSRTKRPLLYVSFVRKWYTDKQNWGTESLIGTDASAPPILKEG